MSNTSTSSVRATKKLIPDLRFPEFVNEGEWEEKSIGDVFNSFSGGTPSTSEKEYYGGKIPFIRSAEINKEETELFLTEAGLKNSSAKLVNKGDLLVALYGANSGDSAISKINGAINQAILCLQSEFSNSFTYNFLTFKKDWIVSRFIQGGQGNLSGDIIKSLSIPFTKPIEQQKIASCLSSLDEVIAAHSQKLDLLKEHKKGLMQNLFPQEGEKVPKLRFKEFVNDGEWAERFVHEFFSVGSSKRVLQEDWTNSGVPFYRTRELVSLIKNEPFGSEIFISEELFLELSEKYGIPTEGDFLVSGVGTLGICYQVKAGDRFYFKDGNVLWFKRKSGIVPTYFKFCFQSDHIQKQIVKQTSLSTVGTYTIQNAKKTKLWYPPKPEEQQKIASCLSSLDDLITSQAEKTEQLKLHKKGLMQGLFPKINE